MFDKYVDTLLAMWVGSSSTIDLLSGKNIYLLIDAKWLSACLQCLCCIKGGIGLA